MAANKARLPNFPGIQLDSEKAFEDPKDVLYIYAALAEAGIYSPASDLEWVRKEFGNLWRWKQVGRIGEFREPNVAKPHGLFLIDLMRLVPKLRRLSLCQGY